MDCKSFTGTSTRSLIKKKQTFNYQFIYSLTTVIKTTLLLSGLLIGHAVFGINYPMNNSTNTVNCGIGNNFFDSGGSGANYGNNENLTITFTPSVAGQYIQLVFSSFATSSGDILTFYDGSNTSAPLIGSYSQSATPGTIGSRNGSGSITVVFNSTGSGNSSGWAAAITCSASPVSTSNIIMTNGASVTTCGGTFYDIGGASNPYEDNSNQTMTFTPATAGQYVQLDFTSFATSSTSDYLSFYDGPSTASALLGTYSVSASPGTIGARNASGILTVQFISNGSGTSSGWAANISCSATPVQPSTIIMTNGASITTCGGTFYDGGGASNDYENNVNQTVTFTPATAGQYVKLDFTSFATSSSADYLTFYDGPNTSSPLLGVFSLNSTPGIIGARNASGVLTVRFISNGSGTSAGWAATITCSATAVQPSNIIMTNGASVTTCSGTFYDEGGSSNDYSDNSNQTMTFTPATSGQYVQLVFTSFATSPGDYLYVYDGPSTASNLLGIFSGSSTPGTIGAANASGVITVKFTSTGSGTSAGWAATVSCSASPVQPTNIIMTNGANITTCGGTFYDEGGASNDYGNNLSQTMTFNSLGAGLFIRLTFTSFNTASAGDFISFYNGPSTASTLIGTYSGSSSPGTINATVGTSLTVQFTSNGSGTSSGWAANVTCTGALPIELVSFDAVCNEGKVDLHWETASETNNDYFTIERSTSLLDFQPVATMKAVGNSKTISRYQLTDEPEDVASESVLYYRLKQTDFDQRFEYFKAVRVIFKKEFESARIYPNPTKGIVIIDNIPLNANVIVFNFFGKVLFNESAFLGKMQIDLSGFKPGLYPIRIVSKEGTVTKKIVLGN